MKITIDPVKMTAALKAVREFASEDSTRSALCNVLAESNSTELKLTATDGHTLCSVTVSCNPDGPGTARLSPLVVDTLLFQAKNEKSLTSTSFDLSDDPGAERFPDYAQIVPEKASEKDKALRVHGFDGRYLARVGTVQKLVKARNARIQMGEDAASPMRADLDGDIANATVILMPVLL